MTKKTGSADQATEFGNGDATYRAAGGIDGITALVDHFYHHMDTLPEAAELRAMHPDDLTLSRQKLAYFLSGWMGGPKLFREHFGPIHIPAAHSHLLVNHTSKDAWLKCMALALDDMGYPAELKAYLMKQLSIPAESIRLMSKFKGPGATDQ